MKKQLVTFAITLTCYFSYAQTNIYESGGNVGIKTTAPLSELDVNGSINIKSNYNLTWGGTYSTGNPTIAANAAGIYFYPAGNTSDETIRFSTAGNVGIGTVNPFARLHIQNADKYTGTIAIGNSTYPGLIMSSAITGEFRIDNRSSSAGHISFYPSGEGTVTGSEAMRVAANGNVGIGTTTPDARLAVNGTIHSKEVKVDLTSWPDYVFKPDYDLPSLMTVKTYINKNQHLSEMPSAQEVEKNGLNLGEIVKLQTRKIEELTLYLIEENKKNQKQEQQISELKSQLAKLIDQE